MLVMPPETLAGELNLGHTGKTVTVKGGGATVTGVLVGVQHSRELVTDARLYVTLDESGLTPGRAKTTVTLIPGLELDLAPNSIVRVEDL